MKKPTEKEINTQIEYFIKYMGKGLKFEEPSADTFEKYKGVFLTDKDDFDIINLLWNKFGFCSFKNGLFWMINPDEYIDLVRQFPNVSDTSIPFARTGLGGFFLWDKMDIGDSILYLNIHTGEADIISTSFVVFIIFSMPADSFWKRECYGKMEIKANKKFGLMKPDECYAYNPALALGGNETIKKLGLVKLKEQVDFLSQLYK